MVGKVHNRASMEKVRKEEKRESRKEGDW